MLTPSDDAALEPLDDYFLRRARSTLPLSPGEAATIAIAVLRGCAETAHRRTPGAWCLTPFGRPVFIVDGGRDDVFTATASVLERLIALLTTDERPAFARVREGLLTEPPRAWDALERRLHAAVEPTPLVLGPLTPAVEERPLPDPAPVPPTGWVGTLVDADIAAAVKRAAGGVLGAHRRRLLLVGAAVAAVALTAGFLLMPATESPPPVAGIASPEPTRPTAPSSTPSPTDADPTRDTAVGSEAATDAATAAPGLLRSLAACGDDACRDALREGTREPGEPLLLDPESADVTVIEDFGGVAVVRLATGEHAQHVTVVRGDDRWLVRSVRDVANQPS